MAWFLRLKEKNSRCFITQLRQILQFPAYFWTSFKNFSLLLDYSKISDRFRICQPIANFLLHSFLHSNILRTRCKSSSYYSLRLAILNIFQGYIMNLIVNNFFSASYLPALASRIIFYVFAINVVLWRVLLEMQSGSTFLPTLSWLFWH